MKGCPLSCVWCHNPEGISVRKQKMYTKKKCIGCSGCVSVCAESALSSGDDGVVCDKKLCNLCGKCVEACPTGAMEISGTEYSVDYLMQEIEKETIFMDSSEGGVTFCGGEPLIYPGVLLELLSRCGDIGVHRAVDTTLFSRPETVMDIMRKTDLFLIDLKHMDSVKHRAFCGVPNELILSNLQMIAGAGADFIIRIPLIEGFNADEENITRSAKFLSSLPWERKVVNLLPYHEIAGGKHEKMGTVYNPDKIQMAAPSVESQQKIRKIFENYRISATIGG